MPFEEIDHTADIALVATARDLPTLFVEMGRAFTDCVTVLEEVALTERRSIALAADDEDSLLVAWLEELLYLLDVEGLLLADFRVLIDRLAGGGLELSAEARGEPFAKGGHREKVQVKAVTYHRLEVVGGPDGWRARVVLDV